MLIAAMATPLLISCSEEVHVEVNKGRAIDFHTSIGSRSVPIITEDLTQICVTAIKIDKTTGVQSLYFGGGEKNGSLSELFTKAKGSIYFTSAENFYWPADGSKLQFYAFAPTLDKNNLPYFTGVTINEKSQSINFDTEDQIENQIDLITASAEANKDSETTGVSLVMQHRLSQIEIRAFSNNTKYDFDVSGVRIGRVASKGSFNFTPENANQLIKDNLNADGEVAETYNEWTLGSLKGTVWGYDLTDRSTFTYENVDSENKAVWERLPESTAENKTSLCLMPTMKEEDGTVKKDKDGNPVVLNAFLIPQKLVPWNRVSDFANNTNNGAADNSGAYIAIKLRVTEKGTGKVVYPDSPQWGNGFQWAAVPISGIWEAGRKYTYTLNLTAGAGFVDPTDPLPGTPILSDPIQFSVTVSGWENEDPEEIVWDNGGSQPATGDASN